jgi:hypothetical protein
MSASFQLAQEVARLLDQDPIMASQVKEHIKPDRLREVLGLGHHAPDYTTVIVGEPMPPIHEVLKAYNDTQGNRPGV